MFFLFSGMKALEVQNMWRYPAQTNCKYINEMFNNNIPLYQEYASSDKDLTIDRQGTGVYQCYCKQQSYAELAQAGLSGEGLCYNYIVEFSGGEVMSTAVSIAITIVNTIIRVICVFMIQKVGYHTLSAEITAIMSMIFVATFLNTGLLLLFADANFTQLKILGWLGGFFKGPFPDLTEEWYLVIAPSMILTMFLNSIYPWMNWGISFLTSVISKCLDQGCSTYCCCKTNKTTKCKTIQQYVNLYAGPKHVMSYQYSAILTTVWVTFMYGTIVPILYPMAAFTFFNYYVVDKFLITYYYQRPPVYDDKLNMRALELMKIAPIICMFFGYWFMGNMQIFNSKIIAL